MLNNAQLPAKAIGATTTTILQSIAKPPKFSDLIERHVFLIIYLYHNLDSAHNFGGLVKVGNFSLTGVS